MNDYYVYRYIRLDTNTPFYVGKGKGKRYKDTVQNRNKYFKNIVASIPYEVELILEDLSENESFQKEMEFIKLYKTAGYCEANLTIGGEGVSGLIMSDDTKEKMRKAKLGKPNNHKGVPKSEQAKIKLSKSLKGTVFTEQRKKNISDAKKGKEFSEQHKLALSQAQTGKERPWRSKKIQCIETNEIYDTVQIASSVLEIEESTLRRAIRANFKIRKTGHKYIYLNKKPQ